MFSNYLSIYPLIGGSAGFLYHGKDEQARIAPLGHIGDPEAASVEKGERLFGIVVANSVAFLRDLRQAAASSSIGQGASGATGRRLLEREHADT